MLFAAGIVNKHVVSHNIFKLSKIEKSKYFLDPQKLIHLRFDRWFYF